MNTRLQQFINAENISQSQLADTLNVARAGVSHILAGRNKPSYDFLTALMTRFPKLNIEWLMFGKGKMYKDDSATQTRPESNLLFDDSFLAEEVPDALPLEQEIPVQSPSSAENSKTSSEIIDSIHNVQTIVKQRNVKKILILFDDGTFQEM